MRAAVPHVTPKDGRFKGLERRRGSGRMTMSGARLALLDAGLWRTQGFGGRGSKPDERELGDRDAGEKREDEGNPAEAHAVSEVGAAG